MENENQSGIDKAPVVQIPEATSNNGNPFLQDKLPGFTTSSSSSSLSSSSSSSSNPLESDGGEKDALDSPSTKIEPNGPRSPLPESLMLADVSSQTPEWSMISASPRGGTGLLSSTDISPTTPDWSTLNASPTKSPPIQVMGRGAGYDPKRIPSSVFSTKSTTPTDWSVASNESLFSIHMGNNSFSRDHAILMGKSGELTKPDDWLNSPPGFYPVNEAKSNELNSLPSSLPTVIEAPAETERKGANLGEDSGVKEDAVSEGTVGDYGKEKVPSAEGLHAPASALNASDGKGMPRVEAARNSASTPRLSDESGNSSSSFAFPLLSGEGSVKDTTDKPHMPPHQPQPPPPEQSQPQTPGGTTQKAAKTRWFSCFSCCRLCC